MTQYINKDDLLKEIERLLDRGKYPEEYYCGYRDGNNSALYSLKEIISILEVKEVDLEKELRDFVVGDIDDYDMGLAKHFYELGLKVAQKGE